MTDIIILILELFCTDFACSQRVLMSKAFDRSNPTSLWSPLLIQLSVLASKSRVDLILLYIIMHYCTDFIQG